MRYDLAYLGARLREPGSWRAFALLLGFIGLHMNDALLQAIMGVGMAVGSLLGVLLPENPPQSPPA